MSPSILGLICEYVMSCRHISAIRCRQTKSLYPSLMPTENQKKKKKILSFFVLFSQFREVSPLIFSFYEDQIQAVQISICIVLIIPWIFAQYPNYTKSTMQSSSHTNWKCQNVFMHVCVRTACSHVCFWLCRHNSVYLMPMILFCLQ